MCFVKYVVKCKSKYKRNTKNKQYNCCHIGAQQNMLCKVGELIKVKYRNPNLKLLDTKKNEIQKPNANNTIEKRALKGNQWSNTEIHKIQHLNPDDDEHSKDEDEDKGFVCSCGG